MDYKVARQNVQNSDVVFIVLINVKMSSNVGF